MTFFAKLILVSASWCPVYALVAVLVWPSRQNLAIILLALGVVSCIALWLAKLIISMRFAKELYSITECESQKGDVFMYVLSYIPPFFAIDVSSSEKLFALVLLYIFIFATYVRLEQYHLNPIFVFFGYQVFKVKTSGGKILYVITRQGYPIRRGDEIRLVTFAELALAF